MNIKVGNYIVIPDSYGGISIYLVQEIKDKTFKAYNFFFSGYKYSKESLKKDLVVNSEKSNSNRISKADVVFTTDSLGVLVEYVDKIMTVKAKLAKLEKIYNTFRVTLFESLDDSDRAFKEIVELKDDSWILKVDL